MRRVQGPRRSKSGSTEDEDQEEETELVYNSGQQQRLLNLHHYVGHSLIKHQPHTTTPPPTFRPLSRTQPHPAAFQQKNHKQGLKASHSHGGSSKSPELTGLQRRAAELTGVPLINFNIKRSAAVRTDLPQDSNDVNAKPETQVKFDDFNAHQHPPLYQIHHIHHLQQHLRFLSAYQHSGLLAMKGQPAPDLTTPPSSPTLLTAPPEPTCLQDRTLRKNYSMCEDILANNDMKDLWEQPTNNNDFNFGLDNHLNNNRVNFKLGATLSLPQMLLVGDVSGSKDFDAFSSRTNEFQMGKEDEARFLPTDLLSDETTTAEQPQLQLSTAANLPVVKLSPDLDNDYGFTDSKSLPTFLGETAPPMMSKKQSLRKAVSLQGDQYNCFYPTGSSDFSLFPQTSQSDLLCSLRSSLVRNSTESQEHHQVGPIYDESLGSEHLPSRKITTTRHLERAIKSLSINTDISRKF